MLSEKRCERHVQTRIRRLRDEFTACGGGFCNVRIGQSVVRSKTGGLDQRESLPGTKSRGPPGGCVRHLTERNTRGGTVKKAFVVTRNIVGVAGLLLAGYVLVTSIPDMGRYIKISTM